MMRWLLRTGLSGMWLPPLDLMVLMISPPLWFIAFSCYTTDTLCHVSTPVGERQEKHLDSCQQYRQTDRPKVSLAGSDNC